jgi:flavin-dependent dehydrogenase
VSASGLAVLERTGLGEWASQFTAPRILRLSAPDDQVLDVRPKAKAGHCYGRTIPRRLLDARLAQAAVEAGARLIEGTRVRDVARSNGGPLHIIADGLDEIETQVVILADGSNAPLTRHMGLLQTQPELVAIRQYLARDAGPKGRIEIHFERHITPGYTWIFPVGGGYANVGTGTFTQRVHQDSIALREVLNRFTSDPSAAQGRLARAEPIGPARGHPLRTRLSDTRTHAERMLVAGDAAGLINPFTGEGIATAMESGELAAAQTLRALEAGDFSAQGLAPYSQALESRYRADQQAGRILRLALNHPKLLNRIFRQLRQDEGLALLIGDIILGHTSPRLALRPRTLLRLLT